MGTHRRKLSFRTPPERTSSLIHSSFHLFINSFIHSRSFVINTMPDRRQSSFSNFDRFRPYAGRDNNGSNARGRGGPSYRRGGHRSGSPQNGSSRQPDTTTLRLRSSMTYQQIVSGQQNPRLITCICIPLHDWNADPASGVRLVESTRRTPITKQWSGPATMAD